MNEKNSNTNSNKQNKGFLIEACKSANPSLEVILKLIEIGGRELVMQTTSDGDTALHWACRSENPSLEVITKMIEIGGRELVMQTNSRGNTALHWACGLENPSLEVILKLIEIGGRELVMQTADYGATALHWACNSENPSLEVITKLIEIGGRELVMQTESDEETALHWACGSENPSLEEIEVITKLIEIGGKDLLTVGETNNTNYADIANGTIKGSRSYPVLLRLSSIRNHLVMKALISAGIQHKVGGEFGIGGLFNSCDDTYGDIDNSISSMQMEVYSEWNHLITPALDDMVLLLHQQPILHAAILSKAPSNIIHDIIDRFPRSVSFQDSSDRYPIDVAIEEGLGWDEGLRVITETLATQQGRAIIFVAAYHGLEWDNGMKNIAEENTTDIGKVDELTGFYPFALAANSELRGSSSSSRRTRSNLNTIFYLMKKSPSLLRASLQ